MPKFRSKPANSSSSSVYDCISRTNIHLYQPPPPPSLSLDDIDFTQTTTVTINFSLERLISVEKYCRTTTCTGTHSEKPMQKLSDLRSHHVIPSPSVSSTTLVLPPTNNTSIVKQLAVIASLPSPKDTLKMLRRNSSSSTSTLQYRGSRKRSRQQQSSTAVAPLITTITEQNNSTSYSTVNTNNNTNNTNNTNNNQTINHNNTNNNTSKSNQKTTSLIVPKSPNHAMSTNFINDNKRARTNRTPSTSLSLSSSNTTTTTTPIKSIENEENQIKPSNQLPIQSLATPTKIISPKISTPRTPKELEEEVDVLKKELFELKELVTKISKNKTATNKEIVAPD